MPHESIVCYLTNGLCKFITNKKEKKVITLLNIYLCVRLEYLCCLCFISILH